MIQRNNFDHDAPAGKLAYQHDFLWENLKDLPYFRAILRAVEARFYQRFDSVTPTLDLGCGDGHFAAKTFASPPQIGIDIDHDLVKKAREYHGHVAYVQCFGDSLPFATNYFNRVLSNSVLEHIEDLDAVIQEVSRVLSPGGDFIFCVPSQNFLKNLSLSNLFDRIAFHGLAEGYRSFFNKISRHYHCDSPEVWQERLHRYGFQVEEYWHYFSPEALSVLEWGHYFGLPSLVSQWIFKRWILVPKKWNLHFTKAYIQKYYEDDPEHPVGSYTFYITRKK